MWLTTGPEIASVAAIFLHILNYYLQTSYYGLF